MKKNCPDCAFVRKEYGNQYCMACWNSGGKEKDEAVRAKIDSLKELEKEVIADIEWAPIDNQYDMSAENGRGW